MTVGWNRVSQWAQVSDCGQYSVACVRVNDAYRFEAWKQTPGKAPESLGIFDDAEAARQVCREHKAGKEAAA